MEQRLQKALAAAGVASRRHAEQLIASGRVAVDGKVVTVPGTKVDPDAQAITVDGAPMAAAPAKRHYVALHKPIGYVSTTRDRHAPRKVTDLVDLPGVRLVPVGRLDADSEGLILLSDDGDFVYRVTHPSHHVGKVYQATVKGTPDAATLKRLSRGLVLDDGVHTAPASARKLGRGPEPGTSIVELVLHEGRNRQVRRMLDTVGHPVIRLVRTQIGTIPLGNLAPGAWRPLSPAEVAALTRPPAPPDPPRRGRGSGGGAWPAGNGGNIPRQPRQQDRQQEKPDETRYRRGSRPGPGEDHRGAAPERVQVHQDRVDGRVPARGKRDPARGRGGEGRGPRPPRDRG
jgi:pseudouridine synthase